MRGSGRGEGNGIAPAGDNLFRIGLEGLRSCAKSCADGPGLHGVSIPPEHSLDFGLADPHTLGGSGDARQRVRRPLCRFLRLLNHSVQVYAGKHFSGHCQDLADVHSASTP